jgi:two-component system phosphate regulon sensor histidine kinase PhoR
MAASITLLLLLQTLWLVNSYDQAYHDVRRRASDLFRGALVEMRDSLFMKNFEKLSPDTVHEAGGKAMFFALNLDTVAGKYHHERLSRTEIVVSRKRDTVPTRLIVRFDQDTLTNDTISYHYKQALLKAGIDLPFTLKKENPLPPEVEGNIIAGNSKIRKRFSINDDAQIVTDKATIATDWMRFAPDLRYAAIFENIRPYIYLQITPQILFSAALTLITSAAFFMMYRSMRSQQKLMDMKNDFISNITHELKTPLTTVSVALEALRNFKGLENPQTTREYLDIAQGELNRLTMLTDKVLKTAVLDKGAFNFESEPVDLHKTVEQILRSMKLIFEKHKAHVTFEQYGRRSSHKNSFIIRGGSIHLTNVVYNLLDNALKYSVNEPHISIRLEEDANQVILKVADKGIGIPAEYKKKIFEKFFRVPTGDVHNIKGYGLGLSYVESVVRSHRGLIEVVSKPGEGSMFTISLPKGS